MVEFINTNATNTEVVDVVFNEDVVVAMVAALAAVAMVAVVAALAAVAMVAAGNVMLDTLDFNASSSPV